ncbi:leucine-rich repeat domain-containing protein [uncultured Polaribacter sp.]|uniref:leucine-rich repeat domain-containing protein n=1 Tax=uncultured Polaribacter sp. TaxID=174711 RepID=UPI00261C1112|nr:T9SS type A sorting domain-containing protein [uncultured Polaribacter sp.]
MKRKLLSIILLASVNLISAQSTTSIPDKNFEKFLINRGIDTDGIVNGKVFTADIKNVTRLSISIVENIRDLTGISSFSALESLNIQDNYLPNIDLNSNTNLESLSLTGTETVKLSISNNTKLKELGLYGSLDDNATLNLTNNINLETLYVTRSKITNIDLSQNPKLIEVDLSENRLTTLDVTNNVNLVELNCNVNMLSSLNTTNLTKLEQLDIYKNNVIELNLSNNTKLTDLNVQDNNLASIDLTANTALRFVRLQDNKLTFVNINNGNNTIISVFRSTNNPTLACIKVDDKSFSDNSANWGKDATSRFSEECNPQTYIADTNFENYLEFKGLGNGENNDNSVDTAKISALKVLDISDENITDLTGIEAFVSLTNLNASANVITSLDLSKNIELETVNLAQNKLTNVDFSKNIKITDLNVSGNKLTTLDLSKNTALTVLDTKLNLLTAIDFNNNKALKEVNLGSNNLVNLDLSSLINLERLDCFNSNVSSINISKNKKLNYADLSSNQLENINLYGNIALSRLIVGFNKLKYLDIQNNTNLVELNTSFNELIGLNLKNTKNWILFNIDLRNNPNLTCVEVDDVSFSTNNWLNKDSQTSFSENCAPYNDKCSNAIPLILGQPTPGDVNSGNTNNNAPCVTNNVIADVWFSIIVPQTGQFNIQGSGFGGQLKLAVYETCNSTTPLTCGTDISLDNLTIGSKLYVKVWLESASSSKSSKFIENGTFIIIAQETSVLSADKFTVLESDFLIYPNPATSHITIASEKNAIKNITIYTILGEKVFSKKNGTLLKETIDTNLFSKGMYVVKIKTEDTVISKKLIVR